MHALHGLHHDAHLGCCFSCWICFLVRRSVANFVSMVLKSDGSGLYATKDLALAKRKFDEFHIDQSIYVVDAAQTLHFKQVGPHQRSRDAGVAMVTASV
jgi:hypothetical protein